MIKRKLKTFLTVAAFTSVFSLDFLHSGEAKAHNAGGGGNVKFSSWDINNYSSIADLWTQTRANYDPGRIKDRVTYGDYDGNGKDEAMAFCDYRNASTRIHRLYEDGGKYYNISIYESGVNNFNASSITNKVVSGDSNGDGKDEILVLYDYFSRASTMFRFLLNNDGRSVSLKIAWNATGFVGSMVSAMVAGDFNSDGRDEALIFYDYGNNVTVVFELTMGSDGKFTSKKAFRATQSAGSQIKGKTVSGDYDGSDKDEVTMFYDYGNATTRILSLINSNGAYSLSETRYSDSFNGSLINEEVVSTHNSGGKDRITALYGHGNNVTGILSWQLQTGGKLTAVKGKKLTNYEAVRVSGRLAVGKIDGITARLLAMYDGIVVRSQTQADKVIAETRAHIPFIIYVHGADDAARYIFDCSSFAKHIFAHQGISLGRTAWNQMDQGVVVSQANLRAGDLVFTLDGNHVGTYTLNGKMIRSSREGVNVIESNITDFYAVRRIL